MSSLPACLPYKSGYFVNRDPEIQLVLDKLRRLLNEEPVERRTVIFHGQRGSGKSWLLLEIKERAIKQTQAAVYYLDLQTLSVGLPEPPVWILGVLRELSEALAEQAGMRTLDLASVDGLDQPSAWVVRAVEQLPIPLLILIDQLDKAGPALLALLEKYFLAPLGNVPHVLLVLTERGSAYPWRAPGLRLQVHHWDLDAFSLDHTTEQLEKLKPLTPESVSDIQELGSGYPWVNYLLARAEKEADRAKVFDNIAQALLADCLDERPFFEALCVLRAFDESRIPPLLKVFSDEWAAKKWDYRACRDVLEQLNKTTMIKWERKAGGYILDKALRPILEKGILLRKPELWRTLHCAAVIMFSAWITNYPRTRERWQNELDYHGECLLQAGIDPTKCTGSSPQE